ncbi:DUF6702 family protein [Flexibacter flexilis]|nr:DUF6702 family protein [Flexibacter flexilis]
MFLKNTIIGAGLLLSFFTKSPEHQFHSSITQIDYNAQTKHFEISIRTFSDDLEKGVGKAAHLPDFRIDRHAQANALTESYVRKCFVFKEKNKILPFQFVGKEIENEVTWIYLEVPARHCDRLQLDCRFLTDVFGDQKNIVNVQCAKDNKKSYLFDIEKTSIQ